jgi:hypothetical protein
MNVVEWRGVRVPRVKDDRVVPGYSVRWELTLECGHIVSFVGYRLVNAGYRCPVCELKEK